MKKIAIPWANGNLCDHFEEYHYFLVYDFENPCCIREEIKYPPRQRIEKLMEWFIDCHITDIIAREIDLDLVKSLNQNKIHVFVGVRKKNPEDLIIDYLNKKLDTNQHLCYHKL